MGNSASIQAVVENFEDDAVKSHEKLKEENALLRKQVRKLQASLEKLTTNPGDKTAVTEAMRATRTSQEPRVEVSAEVMQQQLKEYTRKEVPKLPALELRMKENITKNKLFDKLSGPEIDDCVAAFERRIATKAEMVIKQGDKGNYVYFVESGALDVFVTVNGESDHVSLKELSNGDVFGEIALLYNTPRMASIICKTDCVLWQLHRTEYRKIVVHYKQENLNRREMFLRSVELLAPLNGQVIHRIAQALTEQCFEEGDYIIREGELGDTFYIVEEGTVRYEQFRPDEGQTVSAGDGGVGSFFGELALMKDQRRQASVVALSDVKLLGMERSEFSVMMGSLKELLNRDKMKKHLSNACGESTRDFSSAIPDMQDNEDDGPVSRPTIHTRLGIPFHEITKKAVLGKGAFGQVWLVKHAPTGNTYALKTLVKADIVSSNLQEHVRNEYLIMRNLDHPCCLRLFDFYDDNKFVYFLLELCLGGEIFTILRHQGRFKEKVARHFAAAVVSVFEHMHGKGFVYRDLKPENMLIDSDGRVKIVDFGLSKKVTKKTYTVCGTPDYLAPEIILSRGHDKAVDYWALGILIYEMVAGFVPFYSKDPMKVYTLILEARVDLFPNFFSRPCAELVKGLLNPDPERRFGNTATGIKQIIRHRWFSGFNWKGLLDGSLRCPISVQVSGKEDTHNFRKYEPQDSRLVVSAVVLAYLSCRSPSATGSRDSRSWLDFRVC